MRGVTWAHKVPSGLAPLTPPQVKLTRWPASLWDPVCHVAFCSSPLGLGTCCSLCCEHCSLRPSPFPWPTPASSDLRLNATSPALSCHQLPAPWDAWLTSLQKAVHNQPPPSELYFLSQRPWLLSIAPPPWPFVTNVTWVSACVYGFHPPGCPCVLPSGPWRGLMSALVWQCPPPLLMTRRTSL